ncbi:MAG: hypothetical protein KBD53_08685 [Candidatus Omnitrophica bacterium]|nr:hypothetical protein [Candidatus Omnitrophota bacterium]
MKKIFIFLFLSMTTLAFAAPNELKWGGDGFDPALKEYSEYSFTKYTARFQYGDESLVEIVVDAEETVSDVGSMTLVSSENTSLSSQYCSKAMRHVSAPWACIFSKKDLENLRGKGKMIIIDSAQNQILEDTIDFDALRNFIEKKN